MSPPRRSVFMSASASCPAPSAVAASAATTRSPYGAWRSSRLRSAWDSRWRTRVCCSKPMMVWMCTSTSAHWPSEGCQRSIPSCATLLRPGAGWKPRRPARATSCGSARYLTSCTPSRCRPRGGRSRPASAGISSADVDAASLRVRREVFLRTQVKEAPHQGSSKIRPRVPPRSNAAWASAACSSGNRSATRRVRAPASTSALSSARRAPSAQTSWTTTRVDRIGGGANGATSATKVPPPRSASCAAIPTTAPSITASTPPGTEGAQPSPANHQLAEGTRSRRVRGRVPRRRSGDADRADPAKRGELQNESADGAGGAGHQQRLTFSQIREVERPVGGQAVQRQCCRLGKGGVRGAGATAALSSTTSSACAPGAKSKSRRPTTLSPTAIRDDTGPDVSDCASDVPSQPEPRRPEQSARRPSNVPLTVERSIGFTDDAATLILTSSGPGSGDGASLISRTSRAAEPADNIERMS